MQPQHRIPDALEDPPDDAVPPLVDHDPVDGPFRLSAERLESANLYRSAIHRYAAPERLLDFRRRKAVDEDLVFFLEFIAWVRDAVDEIAIVRQQQEAGRIAIQSPDRNDAFRHLNQIEHRLAPVLVRRSRDVAHRLVEDNVPPRFRAQ